MTKNELDELIKEKGFKSENVYELEESGKSDLYVINQKKHFYNLYYAERGSLYFIDKYDSIETLYDFIYYKVKEYKKK